MDNEDRHTAELDRRDQLHVADTGRRDPLHVADTARRDHIHVGETVRRDQIATDELTPQERVVARLVVQGLTNKQVAEQLFLSPNTIETHLRHIFQKADVRTRTQLAHLLREGE